MSAPVDTLSAATAWVAFYKCQAPQQRSRRLAHGRWPRARDSRCATCIVRGRQTHTRSNSLCNKEHVGAAHATRSQALVSHSRSSAAAAASLLLGKLGTFTLPPTTRACLACVLMCVSGSLDVCGLSWFLVS